MSAIVVNQFAIKDGSPHGGSPTVAAGRDYVRVKAISLWQPWAWLIAVKEKRYETRSWQPTGMKRGDFLLIHAAKRWTGEEAAYCRQFPFNEVLQKHGITDPKHQLPFGALLCLCRLGAVFSTDDFSPLRKERAFGNYAPGRFAWELDVVNVFDKPIPMAGAQSLFSVEIPAELVDVARAVHEPPLREPVKPEPPVEIITTPAPARNQRVNSDIAMLAAKRLVGIIKSECERVEIAGSLRRGKPEVKDVELVVIPKTGDHTGSPLHTKLDAMLANGVIEKAVYSDGKTRWGDRHRGLVYEGTKIEIFTADADNWGFQFWLRTGPAEGGSAFMSVLNARSNYRAIDGYIWHGSKWRRDGDKWESSDRVKMSLPEEKDFFALIGLPVVAPGMRTAQTYQPLWRQGHQWGDPNAYKKKYVRPLRFDDSRYGMLPKIDPQRNEYETMTPVMWKHRLLPLVIADLEKRIGELRAEGKDVWYLERLLEAHRERLVEGEEAIREGRMRE